MNYSEDDIASATRTWPDPLWATAGNYPYSYLSVPQSTYLDLVSVSGYDPFTAAGSVPDFNAARPMMRHFHLPPLKRCRWGRLEICQHRRIIQIKCESRALFEANSAVSPLPPDDDPHWAAVAPLAPTPDSAKRGLLTGNLRRKRGPKKRPPGKSFQNCWIPAKGVPKAAQSAARTRCKPVARIPKQATNGKPKEAGHGAERLGWAVDAADGKPTWVEGSVDEGTVQQQHEEATEHFVIPRIFRPGYRIFLQTSEANFNLPPTECQRLKVAPEKAAEKRRVTEEEHRVFIQRLEHCLMTDEDIRRPFSQIIKERYPESSKKRNGGNK
ncbi:hypothetical protein V8E52_011025 [Russula decolorans]